MKLWGSDGYTVLASVRNFYYGQTVFTQCVVLLLLYLSIILKNKSKHTVLYVNNSKFCVLWFYEAQCWGIQTVLLPKTAWPGKVHGLGGEDITCADLHKNEVMNWGNVCDHFCFVLCHKKRLHGKFQHLALLCKTDCVCLLTARSAKWNAFKINNLDKIHMENVQSSSSEVRKNNEKQTWR